MSDFYQLMLAPFVACAILSVTHAYFGIHVIRRGIIFIDLALAQIAAFGMTCAYALGWSLHSTQSYLLALVATAVGALIVTFLRDLSRQVPLEAFIGVLYVLAAAGAILILSRHTSGGEELKSLLIGHLLFVSWDEIIHIFILYLAVAALHTWRWREFVSQSCVDLGSTNKPPSKLWEFVFFVSFGVVVTSSVELAGVLLVFAYLMIPAICSALFVKRFSTQLLVACSIGVIGSIIGMYLSYHLDLPTGATVVVTLGVMLLVALCLRTFYCINGVLTN